MLIRTYLGDHVTFSMPPAGLACWLYLKDHSIIDPLTDELRNEGILLRPQADYSTGYPAYPALFFGFGRLPILQIEEVLQSLNDLFGKLRKRSEEHTSELQSIMRISYAVFCLKKKNP